MEAHLITLVNAQKNPWTYKVEDQFLRPAVNIFLLLKVSLFSEF